MKHDSGRLEVICGSMFCGKTEELIRRIRRAQIAKQNVQVFKHSLDDRYNGRGSLNSHGGAKIESQHVSHSSELLVGPDTTVVAIDEAQFFDNGIVDVVNIHTGRDIRVILAGLELDFRGEPFGSMPQLLSLAEEVTKLRAICVICGELASKTQRIINGKPAHYADPVILVGADETYEARCRKHHIVLKEERVRQQ